MKAPKTIGQIIKHYLDTYKVELQMISAGKIILYNAWAQTPQTDRYRF